MAKHTQGEWGVAKIDNGQADDEIVSTVNGCMVNIASVFGAGEYSEYRPAGEVEPRYEVRKEEAVANARLIAEAPRMEAVLKWAAHLLAELPEAQQTPQMLALRNEIVETLKQATPEYYGS